MNVEMSNLRNLLIIVLLITLFIIIGVFMWQGTQQNVNQGIAGFAEMLGLK